MAKPVNVSDLETLFDPNRKPRFVGKTLDWWNQHGRLIAEQSAFVADSDCRGLVGTVLELQRDDYWKQIDPNWNEFCEKVFHRPAAWIEQVVEGVRLLHLQHPEQLQAEVPAEAILSRNGGDRRSDDFQSNNISLKSHGTSADYIKARLRRDHPEIAEQLERGEHRSARAAAIAAGFIKDIPSVRLTDPAKAAQTIVVKTGSEFSAALIQELQALLKLDLHVN